MSDVGLLAADRLPDGFRYPSLFLRMVEAGLVYLEPWFLLDGEIALVRRQGLTTRYPDRALFPFAARQDRDDVACWNLVSGRVEIVHDYAESGYEHVVGYPDLAGWLRDAIETFIEFE